jgi:putative ABC transport system permease protein
MTPDAGVVIVSQAMVKRYWPPNTDPIGRRIVILNGAPHDPDYQKPIGATVVGVAEDVKLVSLTEVQSSPNVYLPYTRPVWGGTTIVARTTGPPEQLFVVLRHAVLPIDPDISIDDLHSFDQLMVKNTTRERFITTLLSAFSIAALILASLGLYGVISYAVSQRVPEIGIRMALGARAGDIVQLVVRHGAIVVAIGLAIGAFGAALLANAMKTLLFGVAPFDLATFAGVAILLGLVALLASYIPARRAARVNPLTALRVE